MTMGCDPTPILQSAIGISGFRVSKYEKARGAYSSNFQTLTWHGCVLCVLEMNGQGSFAITKGAVSPSQAHLIRPGAKTIGLVPKVLSAFRRSVISTAMNGWLLDF